MAAERDERHEALAVFLGDWEAEGTSYGGTDQTGPDARANGVRWESTHRGYWHTGEFFLVQDEIARPGGDIFDTLSVMGIDDGTGRYFCRSFENHGFSREYAVTVAGNVWTLTGPTERATVAFSDDNRRQEIVWEWRHTIEGTWLPLCDRVAVRTDKLGGQ